jgi:hypothetical protein
MVFSHGMPFLHAIGFEYALAFAVNSALLFLFPLLPHSCVVPRGLTISHHDVGLGFICNYNGAH